MKDFDPFRAQKEAAFKASVLPIQSHGTHLLSILKDQEEGTIKDDGLEEAFLEFFQVIQTKYNWCHVVNNGNCTSFEQ